MLTPVYLFLYSFYAGLFFALIFKWKFFEIEGVKKSYLSIFFLLKIIAGLALTLIYTYYYTDQTKADIYRYFNDSKVISSILFTNPLAWVKIMIGIGINDSDVFPYILNTEHFTRPAGDLVTNNSFLIRIISVVNYFSFYNIYINTLFFNFITFIGLTALFKTLRIYFNEFQEVLFVPVFLIPSVIFWSSGLLKEPILLFGISFYLYAWFKAIEAPVMWRSVIWLVVALFIAALVKSYVAAILVICSLFLPLRNSTDKLSFPLLKRLALAAFIGFVAWFYFGGDFCEKIIYKRDQFILLAISENAGSSLDTQLADPTCNNLLSLIPSALVNAILRPFLWDKGSPLQYFFAAENLLLMLLVVALPVFFFKKPDGRKFWLALFFLLFALLNYLSIGITIPIMGAIVHYRIAAIPFLLIGVLLLTDLSRLKLFLKW